jgi:hypothetical protein
MPLTAGKLPSAAPLLRRARLLIIFANQRWRTVLIQTLPWLSLSKNLALTLTPLATGGDRLASLSCTRAAARAINSRSWAAVFRQKSQVDFALGEVSREGWGAWHGARDVGIGRWQGVHPNHGRIGTVRPHSGGGGSLVVQSPVYLDGRVIASNTTHHILRATQHDTQAPHFDGAAMYAGPGRQINST